MEDHAKDDKIVWKAANMHHPMFGLHYNDTEFIIDDFKPMMEEYGYEFYFCGHEHQSAYGYTPMFDNDDTPVSKSQCQESGENISKKEWFPECESEQLTRKFEASKGEFIHQFTQGASGKHPYRLFKSQYEKS